MREEGREEGRGGGGGKRRRGFVGLRQMEEWGEGGEGDGSSSEEDEEDKRSSDMELVNETDAVGQLYLEVGEKRSVCTCGVRVCVCGVCVVCE